MIVSNRPREDDNEFSFQTATEDGVEFEQHSFDLLSKRRDWRDRKDALL